jgi:predicted transcriptional regulator
MSYLNKELPQELMADEILSVFKINKIKPENYIDAGTLLLSFRANINGIQSGMDWLIKNGLVKADENKKGNYRLTSKGYFENLKDNRANTNN